MSDIQITVKEDSIEYCISEYRKSGRKCRLKSIEERLDFKTGDTFENPLYLSNFITDEAWNTPWLIDMEFEIQPLSKSVTAEQVREWFKAVFTTEEEYLAMTPMIDDVILKLGF
jgi:hypothetical protein